MAKKLPNNLRAILYSKGYSIQSFANKLGVDRRQITVKARDGYSPRLSTIIKWAEILDMDARELATELHKDGVDRPKDHNGFGYDPFGKEHKIAIIKGKLATLDGRSKKAKTLRNTLKKLNE